jgi:hypothetical protein
MQLYSFIIVLSSSLSPRSSPVYLFIFSHFSNDTAGFGIESNNIIGEVPDEVCGLVHHQNVDMWADCATGEDALECPCCSVCCPGESCI